MSTQTEFDKELEQIFDEMDIYSSLNNFKSVIKQAVDKYVIGKDEELVLPHPELDNYIGVERSIGQNQMRTYARIALWGDK